MESEPVRLPVIMSPRALRDILSIAESSTAIWGKEQSTRYEEAIDDALDSIALNNLIGKSVPMLGKNVRSLVVEQHIVVYRVRPDSLRVLRISHQRQMIRRTDLIDT